MKQYLKMGEHFSGVVNVDNDGNVSDDKFHRGSLGDFDEKYFEVIAHAINSHDELVQMNQELLAELKAMAKAYVNLLEAGKDRIESLGGDCDEVTYMAAHDVALVSACSVIGKHDCGAA